MDTFSDTLLVIVPAPNSTRFPVPEGGVKSYPRIPTVFDNSDGGRDENSNKAYEHKEYVQAGFGMEDYESVMANKPWYFKTIYIEYGGSLLFANYLYNENGERHYDGASASYLGPRNVWGLTGPIVKPFESFSKDPETGVVTHSADVREVIAGDYFKGFEPNVQLRYADVVQDAGEVEWSRSFPDTLVQITSDTQFAIYLPDSYGDLGVPADIYAEITGQSQFFGQGEVPVNFDFYGRFAAEGALPKYSNLKAGKWNLLNNYLPANLSAKAILAASGVEEIKYYVAGTKWKHGFVCQCNRAIIGFCRRGRLDDISQKRIPC